MLRASRWAPAVPAPAGAQWAGGKAPACGDRARCPPPQRGLQVPQLERASRGLTHPSSSPAAVFLLCWVHTWRGSPCLRGGQGLGETGPGGRWEPWAWGSAQGWVGGGGLAWPQPLQELTAAGQVVTGPWWDGGTWGRAVPSDTLLTAALSLPGRPSGRDGGGRRARPGTAECPQPEGPGAASAGFRIKWGQRSRIGAFRGAGGCPPA